MAYIDIDLDDIDTEDLVEEIIKRLRYTHGKKAVKKEEIKELIETISPLLEKLSLFEIPAIECNSLDDKMKIEHLTNVFQKYTLSEIQNRLP